jgi:hypothetical protein
MLVHENFDGKYECTTEEHCCRIAERDWRDWRDEVGIYSVHVALFSRVSRFTRHGLWRWRTLSASCQEYR